MYLSYHGVENCICLKIENENVFKAQIVFFYTVGLDVFKAPLSNKSASLTQLNSYFSLRPEVSLLLSVFSTDNSVLADTVSHHGPYLKDKFTSFAILALLKDRQCKACQQGWELFESSCYLIHPSHGKTWEEAREVCRAQKGTYTDTGLA
uniref:C-type lectin domain-containing protein n=1 Tax=Sander lucioperca TaxID=283035 RepID=A0A8C9Z780_SANLU